MKTSSYNPACRNLVLEELKDKKAREHFEKLGLIAGVKVRVQSPDPASLAHVIQFAKKTGDYPALSHADLCVLALTFALDKAESEKSSTGESTHAISSSDMSTLAVTDNAISDHGPECEDYAEKKALGEDRDLRGNTEEEDDALESLEQPLERLDVKLVPLNEKDSQTERSTALAEAASPLYDLELSPASISSSPPPLLYDDPADGDDARALGLTPSENGSIKTKKKETIVVGCMTADFAMQNVLLQMDLSLVGMEGNKIEKVKTWVLRCHACFKICKDPSKKFCPSCGNPTLLRASVTISSPSASPEAPAMQVHLKKNFQYRTRGTIYSIPAPRPGSAKTGSGEGLILREDQTEYARAMKRAETQRQRDEKKLLSGAIANRGEGKLSVGNWMDPDWIPEIMIAGSAGKGRSSKQTDGMPTIGYGKRNPNERRRK
ncbi:Nin one binding Zn-ribbon like-domain-containing protein [Multifurca ochricompacta]|uniref:20S-pre-rRNA D-site endonuclease NOB1 n=1 Tax=Multifurca ochricompacta TaxID=376703 RepID=A0AAD4MAZ7_9AGAM|nr:Nin one binding Zn-ribbon like-domain-containing protein [Multifurca ochricompacta]